jgi:3-phenylpropionate/cinnamic acid dioxygenase small subunit
VSHLDVFIEIQKRNADYASAIDSGDLESWVELFTEDGLYLAQPRENADRGFPLATIRCEGKGMLRDRVLAIQKTMVFTPRYVRHIISAPEVNRMESDAKIVKTAPQVFISKSSFVVFQTLHMQPTQILAAGEYRDVWQRAGDALLLKERRAVFDTELVPNSLIYPL